MSNMSSMSGAGLASYPETLDGSFASYLQENYDLLGGAYPQDETDLVLVVTADMPLITPETMQRIITAQRANSGPLTMLTVEYDDPRGFGRVLRGPDGHVLAVVEEAQATPEQLEVRELNASVYCFRADWLWPALAQIEKSPKGEYYLTDIVAVAARQGLTVQALKSADPAETIGINNRAYLAEAEAILRRRINQRWMDAGVTLVDPETTYIEPEVTMVGSVMGGGGGVPGSAYGSTAGAPPQAASRSIVAAARASLVKERVMKCLLGSGFEPCG